MFTPDTVEMTYREAICAAITDEMDADDSVLLWGEDVGAAGGVFKTSEGLIERFGAARVRDTPICENGFIGAAIGMAVTGLRPIVEVMFSDFLPSAGDAIVNELPKFRFMSGGQCSVPVTVRSICGAGSRFGTQHSATGESWYMGLPGLKVATVGTPNSAYHVLRAAVRDPDPVLVFEHKSLFNRTGPVDRRVGPGQVGAANFLRHGDDVTIVATLLMLDRSLVAAEELAAQGISVEVIELTWLRPFPIDSIAESVRRTGRIVVVEEQVHHGGWGASLIAELAMSGVAQKSLPRSVSLRNDLLIPYSPSLEDALVPSVATIVDAVVDQQRDSL